MSGGKGECVCVCVCVCVYVCVRERERERQGKLCYRCVFSYVGVLGVRSKCMFYMFTRSFEFKLVDRHGIVSPRRIITPAGRTKRRTSGC